MPWNEPGGDKDPWSGRKKSSSSDKNSPADKVTEIISGLSGNGGGKLFFLLPIAALILWVFAGIYTIEEGQRGVVLQFGKFKEVTDAGLHWVAVPVQRVEVVNIDKNRTATDRNSMLTKDENIIDLEVEVRYRILDPQDYLFNVYQVDNESNQGQGVIYQVMRSAVREVVGGKEMDFIITGGGRGDVEDATKELVQKILNEYKSGLQVVKVNLTHAEVPKDVKDAFDDAIRAREDFNRSTNSAETYANKVLPDARGKAARLLEEANAYKEQVIAKSEGDASRFTNLVGEYKKAPEVTRERLYLDTMEQVMSGTKKIMMDTQSGNNMFYLPLDTGTGSGTTPPVPNPAKVMERMNDDSLSTSNNTPLRSSLRPSSDGDSLREGR